MKRSLISLLLLWLLPFFALAQHPYEKILLPTIQDERSPVTFNLADRMAHYHVPGASIAIVEKGEITFLQGYGIARSDTRTPVDTNTRFQAGSITKTMVAMGCFRMVEADSLDLDLDIRSYLKSWQLPDDPMVKGRAVTIRQLLSHTAGLKNINYKGVPQNQEPGNLQQQLRGELRKPAIRFDTFPGTRFAYANTGYLMLQQVLEDHTGQSLTDWLADWVLEPLEMQDSELTNAFWDAQDRRYSYAYNSDGAVVDGYWYNDASLCAGGLWTTPKDLAKVIKEWALIWKGESDFLSAESLRAMIQGPVPGPAGTGVYVKGNLDSLVLSHSGKEVGFTNYMMAHAPQGDGVIVLTNGDQGGYLFSEMIRGVSAHYGWSLTSPRTIQSQVVDQDSLKAYIGTYRLEFEGETYRIEIQAAGKELVLIDLDEQVAPYPLRYLGDQLFIDLVDQERLRFLWKNGEVEGIDWNGDFVFQRE
ncbi:MAG: serine hydrolase domain-containing protein [Bacteroidota bacterium]